MPVTYRHTDTRPNWWVRVSYGLLLLQMVLMSPVVGGMAALLLAIALVWGRRRCLALPQDNRLRRLLLGWAKAGAMLYAAFWLSLLTAVLWQASDQMASGTQRSGLSEMPEYLLKSTALILAVAVAGYLFWKGFRRFERWRGLLVAAMVISMLVLVQGLNASAVLEFVDGFKAGYSGGRQTKEHVQAPSKALTNPLPATLSSSSEIRAFMYFLRFAVAAAIALATAARLSNRDEQFEISRLESENQRERVARELAEARLKLLQAQIEPHFLFNTLGALQHRAEGKAPEAAALAADLIRFLRGSMDTLRAEQTTLKDDFALAEAYLGVMQARMGERLRFHMDLPAELYGEPLPSMVLLTLVENAIKHGIEPYPPGGDIVLSAAREGANLVVSVADTGRGVSDIPGSGVGLANIRSRLQLRYGDTAKLLLEENEPQGFVARLVLPRALPG
ncbi:MAG: histidine kinase [Chitinimonas sp.]|nr:histidine kinase [Chitinimonas sp.]